MLSIVYPSPSAHVQASVLSEICMYLSSVCDQLSLCHTCQPAYSTCLHSFVKKNKIKVDDSCVWWRLYQSLWNPEVPLTQCFGRQNLISGYLCCWVCNQVWGGARACLWHWGIWYKAYKKSCLKEWMFISFTNRMSSFSPTESEKDVMLLVWCSTVCFFWGCASVCVRVCLNHGANI